MEEKSIWASNRKELVRVGTRGPDGVEDQFEIETSREVYATGRATVLHADKYGCDSLDVEVRINRVPPEE